MKKTMMLMGIGLLTSFSLLAMEADTKSDSDDDGPLWWKDTKESIFLMGKGFVEQFKTRNNLYYLGAGAGASWYAFEHDDRVQARYGGTEIANIVDHVGDLGVVLNFPVMHAAFYYHGRKTDNEHSIQFAKEYFAAMYLALIETGALSYIHVHDRPNKDDISFWEKEFRGDSSWPSGHVIPYMTLFFKTLQFYGPAWSTIPFVLSVAASMQRVQDNKHFLSDVISSFFLSAFASEGVRQAAGYKKNHPFYKWLFEHEAQLGVARLQGSIGPQLSWTY